VGLTTCGKRGEVSRSLVDGLRGRLVGDAVLGLDHPGELLEAHQEPVQQVRRGGVGLVDRVVDLADGERDVVDRGDDQVDRLGGVDLALRELGEARRLRDGRRTPVRGDLDGAHPLADRVGELTG
jgi:hypothetical protein